MPVIRQLPTSVINKIAAGEVIERPASLVKELMENSVDAGSTRIEVSIEKGGTELVRIADDGCGIESEQLGLAVSSHATSKIHSADDLFSVATMGFRGEALASIAEVSQTLIRSRVPDSSSGYQLSVNGGQSSEVEPCGCPVGTIIEVRNLFFNTPVRRKFLKTPQTEIGHVMEAFTRVALANPQIYFCLRHNGKILHELPATQDWERRIGHFFGEEIQQNLIAVESQHEQVHLTGHVVAPAVSRSHNRMQYLFLNGRFIKDRALQHALTEAYRGLLMSGRFPIAFLRLSMPPDQVDVNVHPAKLEVRFQEGGKLYSQMLGTLRSRFLSADLAEQIRSGRAEKEALAGQPEGVNPQVAGTWGGEPSRWGGAATDDEPVGACAADVEWRQRQEVDRWARAGGDTLRQTTLPVSARRPGGNWTDFRKFPTLDRPRAAWESPTGGGSVVSPSSPTSSPMQLAPAPPSPQRGLPGESMAADDVGFGPPRLDDSGEASPPAHAPIPTEHVALPVRPQVMQIQQRYLVCEVPEGMVVIDQHALHERILYEQIKQKVLAGNLETQRLLVPQPVELTPAEAAAVLEVREQLARMGLGIESFGGGTILVTSYPSLLKQHNLAELVQIVVDHLHQGKQRPDPQDWLDHLLSTMACKAAVKAGDRLSQEEMLALLEHRDLCRDAHHCPHGRPSWLVFSREELDKKFKRI